MYLDFVFFFILLKVILKYPTSHDPLQQIPYNFTASAYAAPSYFKLAVVTPYCASGLPYLPLSNEESQSKSLSRECDLTAFGD